METIKILYGRLYQEKIEKENLLQAIINTPSVSQISDCIELIKEIALINNSIIVLDNYTQTPENKEEQK